MRQVPKGVVRGREIRVVTKSRNELRGAFLRDDNGILQLRNGEDIENVDLDDVDVLVQGPNSED